MITIEEAKGLGFVENEYVFCCTYPVGELDLVVGIDYICLMSPQDRESVDLSHLTLEQVKQLITLLKP